MSESENNRRTFIGVGAAFFAVAIAMGITMNSWALALPFAVLAVTFVILGAEPTKGSKPGKDDAA